MERHVPRRDSLFPARTNQAAVVFQSNVQGPMNETFVYVYGGGEQDNLPIKDCEMRRFSMGEFVSLKFQCSDNCQFQRNGVPAKAKHRDQAADPVTPCHS